MRLLFCSCLIAVPLVLGIPLVRRCIERSSEAHAAGHDDLQQFFICSPGLVEGSCREISLHFELLGRLEAITVCEGETVQKGQVLARLDRTLSTAELTKAEAALRLAQAERLRLSNGVRQETLDVERAAMQIAQVEVEHAKKNLQRATQLAKGRTITDQELDDWTSALKTAEAKLHAASAKVAELAAEARTEDLQIADAKIALAEAQVEHAKKMLDMCVITAPRDGVISQILAEPGELTGPADSKPLIQMLGTESLRVRAYVEELDAVRVASEMSVCVTADGMPNVRFPGRVVSCSPGMVSKSNITNSPGERRDVKVREVLIQLQPQEELSRLVIGLPVDVYFDESMRKDD